MNETGHVLWHSLDKQGNISVYDVEWPSTGIEVNIPADQLIEVKNSDMLGEVHEAHGEQPEDREVKERKYKRRKYKND